MVRKWALVAWSDAAPSVHWEQPCIAFAAEHHQPLSLEVYLYWSGLRSRAEIKSAVESLCGDAL